jgi:arylsulfatase A-like enzyme
MRRWMLDGMTNISRRSLLGAAATALTASQPKHPNVLFILTDSWRGQALPQAGDPNLIAPHLTRLAREGAYCSRAYTSYPVCCPSRSAILTGKFPHAAGVTRNHSLLPLGQQTMSAVMKSASYRTGYIGKWHLDGAENPGFVPPARRRGFDYWAAFNVDHRHYDSVYFRDEPAPIRASGFEPDYQTSLAIDFLRQTSRQPFYLYLSFVAPHAPLTPPARHATYNPAALRLRDNVPKSAEPAARQNLAGYYGLCSAVDENVGRLLAELDDRGLADDTIVVFTSDHGHMLGSQGLDEIDRPYEESSGIPLLIRYPRRIRAGITIDALISNVDYAPTLLSLCRVEAQKEMQGVNLASLLTSGRGRSPESIYAEGGIGQPHEWRMIIRGGYKLVVDAALRPTHLYNLSEDPYERENLDAKSSQRGNRDELKALLQRWAARTGDQVG